MEIRFLLKGSFYNVGALKNRIGFGGFSSTLIDLTVHAFNPDC